MCVSGQEGAFGTLCGASLAPCQSEKCMILTSALKFAPSEASTVALKFWVLIPGAICEMGCVVLT